MAGLIRYFYVHVQNLVVIYPPGKSQALGHEETDNDHRGAIIGFARGIAQEHELRFDGEHKIVIYHFVRNDRSKPNN